jgi:hypothetical protein
LADEIPNQNVIRIYRSPADGQWRAHIGPDDGRGVEQLGGTPCQALGRLISQIHGGKYLFDPSWCPVEPPELSTRGQYLLGKAFAEIPLGPGRREWLMRIAAAYDPVSARLVR